MTYEELVQKAKDIYEGVDASNIHEHIAFQFDVRGEGEGAFYMEVADGKVKVEPYEYFDHDALITTSQDMLLKIATGQVDPINAYFTHKIQVDGDLGKAARLKELSEAAVELAKKAAQEEAAKGVDVPQAAPKKRVRRTKAEIEAEKAAKAAAKTEREAAKAAKAAEEEAPKKRTRRTKAEIEAAEAAKVGEAVKAAEAAKAKEVAKAKEAEKTVEAETVEAAVEVKAPAKRRPGRPRKNAQETK